MVLSFWLRQEEITWVYGIAVSCHLHRSGRRPDHGPAGTDAVSFDCAGDCRDHSAHRPPVRSRRGESHPAGRTTPADIHTPRRPGLGGPGGHAKKDRSSLVRLLRADTVLIGPGAGPHGPPCSRPAGQDRRNGASNSRSSTLHWRAASRFDVPILPDTLRPEGRCVTVIHTSRWPDRIDFPRPDSTSNSAASRPNSANTSGSDGRSPTRDVASFFGRRSPTCLFPRRSAALSPAVAVWRRSPEDRGVAAVWGGRLVHLFALFLLEDRLLFLRQLQLLRKVRKYLLNDLDFQIPVHEGPRLSAVTPYTDHESILEEFPSGGFHFQQ